MMLEPSCTTTTTRNEECRCEDKKHSGEALTLRMLNYSQDGCERKFETHRGRVAHEVHVTDLGVTRGLGLYATMVMTTNVCPLRQTVLANLQTETYVSLVRFKLSTAIQTNKPKPKFKICRLKPILRLRALGIRTTKRFLQAQRRCVITSKLHT